MASLNEIRNRVSSIASTQKITGAMKLVASAKLRKAQSQIENYKPYSKALLDMLGNALSHAQDVDAALIRKVPKETKFAILVFSSNGSLCGAFNHNVAHALDEFLSQEDLLQAESIQLYGFGKKINNHIQKQWMDTPQKRNRTHWEKHDEWLEKPDFRQISELADKLLKSALKGQIHRVIIIYNHFKNRGVQVLTNETIIPVPIPVKTINYNTDYIFEPTVESLINELLPAAIKAHLFGVILDSCASEHAARANAMQAASENAGQIIEELRMQYNRVRQEVITSEILDIIGGAEAIHKGR